MKIISYESNAQWRAAVEHYGKAVSITETGHQLSGYGSEVRQLIEAGSETMAGVIQRAGRLLDSNGPEVMRTAHLVLGPPIPDPKKIICLGLNYAEHAYEDSQEVPPAPILFAKYRNSLVGTEATIHLPTHGDMVDYEGELAVIVGKTCKDVAEKDAIDYIAGYSCFNDVSDRKRQFQTSQWTAGKALDTFAPMGPGITPTAFVSQPQALAISTRVNGEELQRDTTEHMVFSIAFTVSFISSIMTLEPGDVIATGTPPGVGHNRTPPRYLRHGDVVEVEIEQVGTLRNTVAGPS